MKTFFKNNYQIILTFIFVIFVAVIGSLFVNMGMDWFNGLTKPKQWIPNFVIPIMWTIIYVAFAVVFFILFKQKLMNKKIIVLGLLNGILNILWCLLFFTLNLTLLGNIAIIINAFFATMFLNSIVSLKKWYTNLLWIYPIWVFLATSLNTALWILN